MINCYLIFQYSIGFFSTVPCYWNPKRVYSLSGTIEYASSWPHSEMRLLQHKINSESSLTENLINNIPPCAVLSSWAGGYIWDNIYQLQCSWGGRQNEFLVINFSYKFNSLECAQECLPKEPKLHIPLRVEGPVSVWSFLIPLETLLTNHRVSSPNRRSYSGDLTRCT